MITQSYKEIDGVKLFHADIDEKHTDYNAQGLNDLFEAEERHFWFLARKEFIFQHMKNLVPYGAKIIEIGAGTGNVSKFLMKQGYSHVAIGEMHSNGLKYAQSYGIEECYQFDLLNTPFEDEFEAVCMFDVLEHIANDKQALMNASKMLVVGGTLVLTVPAHEWLWSFEDDIANHKRRYTKGDLLSKLNDAGFEVEISRYFFMAIVPLLWLRIFMDKKKREALISNDSLGGFSINPILNWVLYNVSKIENRVNKFIPNCFGGSLLFVARRK